MCVHACFGANQHKSIEHSNPFFLLTCAASSYVLRSFWMEFTSCFMEDQSRLPFSIHNNHKMIPIWKYFKRTIRIVWWWLIFPFCSCSHRDFHSVCGIFQATLTYAMDSYLYCTRSSCFSSHTANVESICMGIEDNMRKNVKKKI